MISILGRILTKILCRSTFLKHLSICVWLLSHHSHTNVNFFEIPKVRGYSIQILRRRPPFFVSLDHPVREANCRWVLVGRNFSVPFSHKIKLIYTSKNLFFPQWCISLLLQSVAFCNGLFFTFVVEIYLLFVMLWKR